MTDPNSTAYTRAYRAGWDASVRGTDGALERAGRRGAPEGWHDGYRDAEANRPKWACRTARRLAIEISKMGFRPLVDGGRLYVSAEHGDGAADYYGEFRGGNGGYPWINPKLEELAKANGGYWEWQNAGQIVFSGF